MFWRTTGLEVQEVNQKTVEEILKRGTGGPHSVADGMMERIGRKRSLHVYSSVLECLAYKSFSYPNYGVLGNNS